MSYCFSSSRELFESAREAAKDAERCRLQLDELEQRALSVGSPSFDAHVGGGESDPLGRKVAALVDREAKLHARVEDDYRLIDLACTVLYGHDGMSDGLSSLMPPWVADAMWHFYLGLTKWEDIGRLLMYEPRHLQRGVRTAFELMDSVGLLATIEGHGTAEG